MAPKKSLADYQKAYEQIIHADQPRRDILLAGLMNELVKQYKIPMVLNEAWKRENPEIASMYRKLSITRTL
ncbi:hypothetical protein NCCP2222_25250 [Sporosarcina sp. NCCP-2222]|uniref:hypothetical protein n=1 Tax=Sporosarcina sp. NCCP-2222 TaxID=2935073 RepID=UPI0020892936|nr:hypothetical protein [Sporosarcina sp. NCCP-2222]GKV56578.1 hypothetical protein NCCP2222_25250 [Sporosarcina sp. NCCP-2222]